MRLLRAILKGRTFRLPIFQSQSIYLVTHFSRDLGKRGPSTVSHQRRNDAPSDYSERKKRKQGLDNMLHAVLLI